MGALVFRVFFRFDDDNENLAFILSFFFWLPLCASLFLVSLLVASMLA